MKVLNEEKNKNKSLTVTLTAYIYNKMEKCSKKLGINKKSIITIALDEYLNKYED